MTPILPQDPPTFRLERFTASKMRQRWRFPAGSLVKTGTETFRWERTEEDPMRPGRLVLLFGSLEIHNGIGYLGAADQEIPFAREGRPDREDRLPIFPFCHEFHDAEMGRTACSVADFGPWFCLCGTWCQSLRSLRAKCKARERGQRLTAPDPKMPAGSGRASRCLGSAKARSRPRHGPR